MKASTKLVPLEEFIDHHIGTIGSERRSQFEQGYDSFKLGELIKNTRKEKGLSQEELAARAGTNKAYISRIERNLKDIQFSTLQRIINDGLEATLEITIKPR